MKTVNVHEAKTQLSKLIDEVVAGEPFVIAKAGKPMVQVTPIAQPAPRKVGFMVGQGRVPDDFNEMFAKEIKEMFEGEV